MIHPTHRHRQNGTQEWISAIFTLLVLTGIYGSMDNFSSYKDSDSSDTSQTVSGEISSVAPPYWNNEMAYGFRSISGDVYTASGTKNLDTVLVTSSGVIEHPHDDIQVSYYKNTSIDQIDKSLNPESPRAYSRLSHGIAVIQGDIDSPSAKVIFSTLHSK